MAITYTKELIGVSYHPTYQATDGSVTNAIYEIVVRYTGTETVGENTYTCLLYTSPSPRDRQKSRMPSCG